MLCRPFRLAETQERAIASLMAPSAFDHQPKKAQTMLTRKQRYCLSLLCLAVVAPVKADLIFTSPPRESRAKGNEVYQPISDYLSKVTGQKVVYQYPDNWLTYQRDMRKNVYDI